MVMKMRCEIEAKKILPSLRAILSKIMYEELKMDENEIAEKLFLSQAAVSQYLKGKRAKYIEIIASEENILKAIKNSASFLSGRKVDKKVVEEILCSLCKKIQKSRIFQMLVKK